MSNTQLDDPLAGLAARRKQASDRSGRRIAPRTIAPHAPIEEPPAPVAPRSPLAAVEPVSQPTASARLPERTASTSQRGKALRLSFAEDRMHLTVNIRRPLDQTLAELLPLLRERGQKTSKAELIEMLLWELAETDVDGALSGRLQRFRDHAPR